MEVKPSITNILPEPFRSTWIRALRLGYFPQGVNTLKSPEGYCCLGVGAICADQVVEYHADCMYVRDCDELSSALWYGPNEALSAQASYELVEEALRYDTLSPRVGPISSILSYLNDHGVPHSLIADLIEKHL